MPSAPSRTSSPPSKGDAAREELIRSVQLWISDLPTFCQEALTIRTKSGDLLPFRLNRSQLYLHQRLEEQLAKTGMVRAVVLKGRQQGVSTYVQARWYWRTSLGRGRKAYILTHRLDASENLFAMAARFHTHAPVKPHLGTSNAKELVFDKLDSSYSVATAGAKGTGRSSTAQLFHGSEVAFWDGAEDHLSGIGQVVAREPKTEIIYESTANGLNAFHKLWVQAEKGAGDLIAIFIPWFWEPGYRAKPADGFRLDETETAYRSAYGLDMEQMAWRRAKIETDFQGDPARFAQEYPATPHEAFTAVDHDPLIKPELVLAAVGRRIETPVQRLVVGVDPARFGDNSTMIARRRGRLLLPMEKCPKQDTMATTGRLVTLLREERPARIFIDLGGLGAGIYDRLVELGYGPLVTPINFGETANRPDRFVNRRAEMWASVRDWLPGASIPRDDVLARDLSGPTYSYDSDGRLKLESKEHMRDVRGIPSPDAGDALGLTFAIPLSVVAANDPHSSAWDDMIEGFQRAAEHDAPGSLGVHTG